MFCQIAWSWGSLFESIAAAWILLAGIKIISFCRIFSFIGVYNHIDKDNKPEFSTDFCVRYVFLSFISPVPTISIRIDRKTLIKDHSDWNGKFISDILNPFYFRGAYNINDRKIANEPEKDRDGWHELYLLRLPDHQRRIALNLHYIKVTEKGIQQWATDDGYLIEKRRRFWLFSFN